MGDHDQCVYTWRSADLRNLERFEKDFAPVTVITLEENYRSTQTILAAANEIIRRNEHRKEKSLYTRGEEGAALEIYTAGNEAEEARVIAASAREIIASGTSASEIAVLFRANFQSRVLEEAFLSLGVPYQVLGTRFFERKEVKDVLSYLYAAFNPESATHLARIINVPPRGLGKVALLKILTKQESTLSAAARESASRFKDLLSRVRDAALTLPPSKTVKIVLAESGLERELSRGTDDDLERLANVKELASLASRYDGFDPEEGIRQFLDNAALASDQDALAREENSVKLMTVHAAKGLEFEHVFIAGLEEGLFPSERSEMRETPEEREEERRLFYVALTRAKKSAHLSWAGTRTLFGSTTMGVPSRFLSDIPADLVSDITPPGKPRRTPFLKDLIDFDI